MSKKSLLVFCFMIFNLSFSYAHKSSYIQFLGSLGHTAITSGSLDNNGLDVPQTKFKMLYDIGIGYTFIGKKHIGFGTGVFISKEGFKKELLDPISTSLYLKHKVSYLRVPLNFYFVGGNDDQKVHPVLFAGISLGFKLTDAEELWTQYVSNTNHVSYFRYKPFDFGVQAGIAIQIDVSKRTSLLCGLKAYQGLIDVLTEDQNVIINSGNNLNQNIGLQFGVQTAL